MHFQTPLPTPSKHLKFTGKFTFWPLFFHLPKHHLIRFQKLAKKIKASVICPTSNITIIKLATTRLFLSTEPSHLSAIISSFQSTPTPYLKTVTYSDLTNVSTTSGSSLRTHFRTKNPFKCEKDFSFFWLSKHDFTFLTLRLFAFFLYSWSFVSWNSKSFILWTKFSSILSIFWFNIISFNSSVSIFSVIR